MRFEQGGGGGGEVFCEPETMKCFYLLGTLRDTAPAGLQLLFQGIVVYDRSRVDTEAESYDSGLSNSNDFSRQGASSPKRTEHVLEGLEGRRHRILPGVGEEGP